MRRKDTETDIGHEGKPLHTGVAKIWREGKSDAKSESCDEDTNISPPFESIKIKMIKELLLIIIGVAVADAAVCRITTCLTFQCGEASCPPGFRVKYRGGFCGCCDNCVEALNKGDACKPDIMIGGEGNHKGVTNSHPMCDYGLKCDEQSETCVEDENAGNYNQTSSS
ncbi:uncharacterized protein TNCV_3341801 [Trichonephila clavipes]|nr:uncharacterized protein TNCV_3341801 [Trichonephila clavipes]